MKTKAYAVIRPDGKIDNQDDWYRWAIFVDKQDAVSYARCTEGYKVIKVTIKECK